MRQLGENRGPGLRMAKCRTESGARDGPLHNGFQACARGETTSTTTVVTRLIVTHLDEDISDATVTHGQLRASPSVQLCRSNSFSLDHFFNMSKLWEVDPETRSKLLEISKTNENNRCVDCSAPSPQWVLSSRNLTFETAGANDRPGFSQIRDLLLSSMQWNPP